MACARKKYFPVPKFQHADFSNLQLVIIWLSIFIFLFTCSQLVYAETSLHLLQHNKISQLESLLGNVQRQFEDGKLTEVDLRNAYRPFYHLDEVAEKNLVEWAHSFPKSYIAHLTLGIYYKIMGSDARGTKSMAQTPRENIDQMTELYAKATKELRASLYLTPKPYLSIFHLLTISMQFGDRKTSLALVQEANRILPNNSLIRNRYAVALTPRWGGSYAQLDEFISNTKAEGVPSSVVFQLEAINFDDKGHTLELQNQHAAAMEYFGKALELGDRVGGTFAKDWLHASRYFGCNSQNTYRSCR